MRVSILSGFLMATGLAAGSALAAPASSPPPASTAPYAMRGIPLGISLAEFRQIPIILDNKDFINPQIVCSDQPDHPIKQLRSRTSTEVEAGVSLCQWFAQSSYTGMTLEVFVDLGEGKGAPVFEFIKDQGVDRLFRISFYANSQYYPGILSGLSRAYSAPKTQTSPFQTKSGATFQATTSTWSNGSSTIILDEMCRRIDRYCLTYRHNQLGRIYDAAAEQVAAKAATKI